MEKEPAGKANLADEKRQTRSSNQGSEKSRRGLGSEPEKMETRKGLTGSKCSRKIVR